MIRWFNPPCPCCCTCENKDVLLLIDTTGSMISFLVSLKQIFNDFEEDFATESCYWAVADYKDVEDGGDYTNGWSVKQTFTNDFSLILTAVNALTGLGGGDLPEQQFMALKKSGDEWYTTLGARSGDPTIQPIIIWCGDKPGWNDGAKGFAYPTQASVISSLQNKDIEVYGLNVMGSGTTTCGPFYPGGIDGCAANENDPYQATNICGATNGEVYHNVSQYEDIRSAMCTALS